MDTRLLADRDLSLLKLKIDQRAFPAPLLQTNSLNELVVVGDSAIEIDLQHWLIDDNVPEVIR